MDSTAILPPKLELLLVSDASSCPEIAAPGGEYRVAKLAEEAAEVSAGGREAGKGSKSKRPKCKPPFQSTSTQRHPQL